MLKSGFLMWYQTNHNLHIQNTSTMEIFSGEKKECLFASQGTIQNQLALNIEESMLSSFF